ncbi:metallophosphoesterase [Bradyrhizobium sp. 30]|uniref:metallophosphoesterase n=1 Tax=Bradyrhizobium sp. 30 TaxID=2782669 RepID=UPI001FF8FD5B|nr:metallophosphoesterase [Bradyrhizobium sp. 30]MCK1291288.1 metallophosphoesterase [Bradyrhizobium sp. 30]
MKRPAMVGWYDPPRLIAIAIRVAISTIFGEFADRRESLATARAIEPDAIDPAYDYSAQAEHEDFWLDFAADTGDGWNPTYAMARLLAEPSLEVCGCREALPRGRLLVLGGDEVYPTASREDYQRKVVAPFDEAARGKIHGTHVPHLYAIPGNHDWYDGLLAFLGLFCRRRKADAWAQARPGRGFGGRVTQQTRSYFALKLPRGWWLWGADVQLAGYIDQPQIDFFLHVALNWMEPGSRLILCTGQPSWTYVDPHNPDPQFKNFSYLESLVYQAQRQHRLCVVLAGDSHHYSRYVEGECNYLTAGGGGAFLHPTHQLQEKKFLWDYPAPGSPWIHGQTKYAREFQFARGADGRPAIFPNQRTSQWLACRNAAFAVKNPQYAVVMGCFWAVFAWLLHAQAAYLGSSLIASLAPEALPPFSHTVLTYLSLVFLSPWPSALVLLTIAWYYFLADYPPPWRLFIGVLHGSVHAIVAMLAICLLARFMAGASSLSLIIATGIAGGALSATMLGIYFLLSLNLFGRHWNEAFSALRIEDYKCFLRLRVGLDGTLHIFPIGLNRVPREPRTGPLRKAKMHPHLIEQPVQVH